MSESSSPTAFQWYIDLVIFTLRSFFLSLRVTLKIPFHKSSSLVHRSLGLLVKRAFGSCPFSRTVVHYTRPLQAFYRGLLLLNMRVRGPQHPCDGEGHQTMIQPKPMSSIEPRSKTLHSQMNIESYDSERESVRQRRQHLQLQAKNGIINTPSLYTLSTWYKTHRPNRVYVDQFIRPVDIDRDLGRYRPANFFKVFYGSISTS